MVAAGNYHHASDLRKPICYVMHANDKHSADAKLRLMITSMTRIDTPYVGYLYNDGKYAYCTR